MGKKLSILSASGWLAAIVVLVAAWIPGALYGGEGEAGAEVAVAPPGLRIEVSGREKLLSGDFLRAVFSSDGSLVILTGESYRGLWVARRDGSGLRRISDEVMAGWRPVGVDSSRVIYRSARLEHDGGVGYSIKSHDLKTGVTAELYSARDEDIYPPVLVSGGDRILFIRDAKPLTIGIEEGEQSEAIATGEGRMVFASGGRIWEVKPGYSEPREVSRGRVTCGGEVLSPDGSRVAYLHGDSNSVIVYDFNTGGEIDLGRGAGLSWSPDGELLAFSVTDDDGYRITASDLFVARADGRGRVRLTATAETAEINPAWSPDGKKMLCVDAFSGDVYLLGISRGE